MTGSIIGALAGALIMTLVHLYRLSRENERLRRLLQSQILDELRSPIYPYKRTDAETDNDA